MPPLVPLQIGGIVLFRLFGLVFAGLGLLNVIRPREMTAYAIRRRAGGPIEGQIEPTATRLLLTRVVGGVMVLVGAGLALGVLGP
ncbi:MAG TPA: hypothetical protein VKA37_07830 [Halobacteriales archaeon]|nr:hypothetical protein [Halobacteriales archaeon]